MIAVRSASPMDQPIEYSTRGGWCLGGEPVEDLVSSGGAVTADQQVGPPNSCHIRVQIFALATAMRLSCAALISSRGRHTVVSEAIGPNPHAGGATHRYRRPPPRVSDHHRQINEHPAPVRDPPPAAASQPSRQRPGPTRSVGQHP